MATDFLDEQRTKLINLVQESFTPQPDAVAAIVLIDILDILVKLQHPFDEGQ